jgi:hypothetical protein
MDLKRALQILQDKSFDYRKCFESSRDPTRCR